MGPGSLGQKLQTRGVKVHNVIGTIRNIVILQLWKQ